MPGYEVINNKEKLAVKDIFTKNNGVLFAHGFSDLRKKYYVRDFEKKINSHFGSKHALCVSSGTAAIKISLRGLGIKRGDHVITQSFNFIATVEAILDIGAIPIIAKIDESLNLCPIDLEKKISKKTKAVIAVHMLGFSCDMEKIVKICKKKKIPLIEDNCEAIGGKYKNKLLGNVADIGVFSFDFAKNITTGEGGAIITNKKKYFNICNQYHDHGHITKKGRPRGDDPVKISGFNYRMTELQAAIGIIQLKKLSGIIRDNRARYNELMPLTKIFKIRPCNKNSMPSFDTFIFFVEDKKKIKNILSILKKNKIGTKNLPGALKWHFSGSWKHIFTKKEIAVTNDCKKLLDKAIAIPILLKKSKQFYKNLARQIIQNF